MAITDTYRRVSCSSIIINRDERQRRLVDTSDLEPSIAKHGVLVPIIVADDMTLVAGERRLTASIKLGLPDIPVRLVSELDPAEAQILELTENLKRKDLSWQDMAKAIQRIHEIFCASDPEWTQAKTSQEISFAPTAVGDYLRVAQELHNPAIAKLESVRTAVNMLRRAQDRKTADVLAEIAQGSKDIFEEEPEDVDTTTELDLSDLDGASPYHMEAGTNPTQSVAPSKEYSKASPNLPRPLPESILTEDFISWAPEYSGPAFNFIHCDFPYGINVFAGKWSGRAAHNTYNDSPDVYFALLECLLSNLDRLMGHSGHLMFWYSMEYYQETMRIFAERAPDLVVQKFPLIWVKSDNVGIVPDPRRGPRRIYETALIASREDRPIVKVVSNAYSAQTDKKHHHSTKPEPVLRHFFQMFVDESTRMLDPTCGSGSALRAAESLAAEHVLGLEVDPEIGENARSALRSFRTLRTISKGA